MSIYARQVGKTAELQHMKRKLELNGTSVVLQSYSVEKEKFLVRSLVGHNDEKGSLSLYVRLYHLKFLVADEFENRFPDSPVLYEHEDEPQVNPIKYDFSSRFRDVLNTKLVICSSCRMLGVLSSVDLPGRVTNFDGACIATSHRDDIVEFEDMNFTDEVMCKKGKISFVRCRFSASADGLVADGDVSVVLDGCVFESNAGCGVLIRGPSHVTMRNCRIWGSGVAMCLQRLGQVVISHCSITGPGAGIVVSDQGTLHITRSEIYSSIDYGIFVRNKSNAVIKHCHIADCGGDGIVIEGRGGTTALIEDCLVEACLCGIRMGGGKIDVEVNRLSVLCTSVPCRPNAFIPCGPNCRYKSPAPSDSGDPVEDSDTSIVDGSDDDEKAVNEDHGIEIDVVLEADLVGSVILNHITTITGNINVSSGARCSVRIDDKLIPTSREVGLQQMPAFYKGYEFDGCKLYVDQSSARVKRYNQVAGRSVIACKQCHSIEPDGVQFQLCGACKEVRYCSKPCQKKGYKEHYSDCKRAQAEAHVQKSIGYWDCEKCRVAQTPAKKYISCTRCCKVNYCGVQCQVKHSAEHKLVCATLKLSD